MSESVEQNDDETTSDECKVEGPTLLEDINLEEDTLDERKESSACEDHLVSSSTNAAEIKSNNRIVVSNAKIFNNSVIVSVIYPENDNAHLPRSAIDKTVQLGSSDASLPTKMDSKEYKSSRRNANEVRDFTVVESDENDGGNVRAKRGYVFLTDYHNRLKHRLLLQQLETEEKRLKVKIAEMAIQEVQLRIKALSEEMRRTEELHQLHLARIAAGRTNV
ncbi:unnamed protein product [Xylocopa violacea]|uniref:Uncharacterized protein n=1 Tax=Xylocopa violacea TaxID=135666 RepID=A0ABP1MVU4_XYLVO